MLSLVFDPLTKGTSTLLATEYSLSREPAILMAIVIVLSTRDKPKIRVSNQKLETKSDYHISSIPSKSLTFRGPFVKLSSHNSVCRPYQSAISR